MVKFFYQLTSMFLNKADRFIYFRKPRDRNFAQDWLMPVLFNPQKYWMGILPTYLFANTRASHYYIGIMNKLRSEQL